VTVNESAFAELIVDRERFHSVRDSLVGQDRKKLDERLVLEKVYRRRNLAEVNWREKPDFSLRLRHASGLFGVEVSRYYDSESEARLTESPGYSQQLLSGGALRHKNDGRGFSVTTVTITGDDGQIIAADEPAIMREMPAVHAVIEGVGSQIVDKGKLFPHESELSHVNLIVDERTGVLATSESRDLCRHLRAPGFNDAVFRSRFREIFLVTRFKSGPCFVPLKMLLGLAQLHFFDDALATVIGEQQLETYEYMELFARNLSSIADGVVGIRREGTTAEVLYGDTGYVIVEDAEGVHTAVRMYRDAEWPSFETAPSALSPLDAQIHAAVSELMARNTFASNIAFAVSLF
jgi:hypothetical protein